MKTIGFIGCGNMGGSILKGILKAQLVKPEAIYVHTASKAKMDELNQTLKVNVLCSNAEVVKKSEIIFLAVKPQMFDSVFEEIKVEIKDQVFVSIAAGQSLGNMLKLSGKSTTKLIRTHSLAHHYWCIRHGAN